MNHRIIMNNNFHKESLRPTSQLGFWDCVPIFVVTRAHLKTRYLVRLKYCILQNVASSLTAFFLSNARQYFKRCFYIKKFSCVTNLLPSG